MGGENLESPVGDCPTGAWMPLQRPRAFNWAKKLGELSGENSESAGLKLSGSDKKTAKMSGNSHLRDKRLNLLTPSRLPFRHPG